LRPPWSAIADEARKCRKKSVKVVCCSPEPEGWWGSDLLGIKRLDHSAAPHSRNTCDKGPNHDFCTSVKFNHEDTGAFELRPECGGKGIGFRKWVRNTKKVKVGLS
jgi:hypothetical protein